jgi:hypothetical protein
MPSVSDKLKSLGVKTGTTHLPPPKPAKASRYQIEKVVAGEFQSTPRGEVFVSEQSYPHLR